MPLRILCLGDVVGRPGRQILHQKLPNLVRERAVDLVIANAENIAGGSGITANLFQQNPQLWRRRRHARRSHLSAKPTSSPRCNPANASSARPISPPPPPGRRYTVVTTNSGISVGVFSPAGPNLHEPARRRSLRRRRSDACQTARNRAASASATCTPRPPAKKSPWATGSTAAAR